MKAIARQMVILTILAAIFVPLIIWAVYSRVGGFVLVAVSGISFLIPRRRGRKT